MDSFRFAFEALAPLMILALLGYGLRRYGVLSDAFIDVLNRYIFVVALPVLVFLAMAQIEDFSALPGRLIVMAFIAMGVTVLSGVLASLIWIRNRSEKPVVVQAFFRGNFVLIGIPLVTQIGGLEALAVMVLLNAFMIPVTNTLSIIVFSLWQREQRITVATWRHILLATVKNPLMIALALGFLAYRFQSAWQTIEQSAVYIPQTLKMIGQTATPMALIAVGGQFRFRESHAYRHALLVGTVGRMVCVPLIVILPMVIWFSDLVPPHAWPAMIALFASPVAVSSVAVTRGLKGDDTLASHLVLTTTALGIFTLFMIVAVLNLSGFL